METHHLNTIDQAKCFAELEGLKGRWVSADEAIDGRGNILAMIRDSRTDEAIYLVAS